MLSIQRKTRQRILNWKTVDSEVSPSMHTLKHSSLLSYEGRSYLPASSLCILDYNLDLCVADKPVSLVAVVRVCVCVSVTQTKLRHGECLTRLRTKDKTRQTKNSICLSKDTMLVFVLFEVESKMGSSLYAAINCPGTWLHRSG